ncbi:hypothetical protein [Moraxella ovis]|nr:hypothetical protein [Moraxella ovis]
MASDDTDDKAMPSSSVVSLTSAAKIQILKQAHQIGSNQLST